MLEEMEEFDEEGGTNWVLDNIEDLSKVCDDSKQNIELQMFSLNIRSIRKNWDNLVITLERSKISWDLIFLVEINIRENETDLYKIDGYTAYWKTREETKRGGGLVVFIKNKYVNDIQYEWIKIEGNDTIELVMEINRQKRVIIGAYRQPKTDIKKFIKGMSSSFKKWAKYDEIFWVGDINIDVLDRYRKGVGQKKYKNNLKDQYENLLAINGFEKKIGTATREEIKGNKMTKSYIDHIFVKSKKLSTQGSVIKEKISDHYITTMTVIQTDKEVGCSQNEGENGMKKVISKRNCNKIIKEIGEVDWRILDEINTIDDMYEKAESILKNIFEKHTKFSKEKADIKEKKLGTVKNEWITHSIIYNIKKKNLMWKKISRLQKRVKQFI